MAKITIKNMSVEFKIYDSSRRSIKNTLIEQVTGGVIKVDGNIVNIKALESINIEINEGDRVGFTGRNGAGKTTLLRTLAGLYVPTAGRITIEGSVGTLLTMSAGLDMEASGIENIYIRSYLLGIKEKEIEHLIEDVKSFTELGKFLDLPVRTYSAGMISRLNFAISTSIAPDILIIDEGIGAGDALFKKKAIERVTNFKEKAKILIMASHNKGSFAGYCNKVVTINKGKIEKVEHIE